MSNFFNQKLLPISKVKNRQFTFSKPAPEASPVLTLGVFSKGQVRTRLSGANRGQTGPNGAKWCQTESNGAKRGQTGQNEAKKSLTGQNLAKRAKRAKRGQMGSNGADFLHAHILLWEEKIMFSNPGPQTEIGRAMAILSFSWIL